MPLAHQRRTLGRTGLAVSPVGLGCSGFWGIGASRSSRPRTSSSMHWHGA